MAVDPAATAFVFPVGILRLRPPSTKPLSLTSTLASFVIKFEDLGADSSSGDPLQLLSERRNHMLNSLASSVPEHGIKAIEAYLPGLLGLNDALRTLPPLQDVRIAWCSALGTKYNDEPFFTHSLQVEVLFVLTSYAFLRRAAAVHILAATDDANFDANAKLMAAELRIAAGIFDYIATVHAPNASRFIQEQIPEKVPQTFAALSALCLAEAQQITVKKAILSKTSPSLVTKLMVDCRNRFAGVAAALRAVSESTGGQPTIPVDLLQPVLCHDIAVNKALVEALMYKYLGILSFAAQEHGKAVGYLRAAVRSCTSTLAAATHRSSRDPNATAVAEMYNQLNRNAVEMKNLLQGYEKENSSVFFSPVPSLDQLEVPAEGKSIIKVEPYQPPRPWSVSLHSTATEKCLLM